MVSLTFLCFSGKKFSVECSALASPSFEARGGDRLELEISQILRRMCAHKGALDFASLCIIPGEKCWLVRVDILVLDCVGGNMVDTIALGIRVRS